MNITGSVLSRIVGLICASVTTIVPEGRPNPAEVVARARVYAEYVIRGGRS